jgi:glycine/D-amino acid oxidase-like deaminating enzyme
VEADVAIVGAGTVGAAIAYGLASQNLRVLVLDGGDRDFRAATANFGLVWAHGKGVDMPDYQRLTRGSIDLWPSFSAELQDLTGIDLQYEQRGGLSICLSEEEFDRRRANLRQLDSQLGENEAGWTMLDRAALARLLPKARLGPNVVGASFGNRDGHANPLQLLAALHMGIVRKGGVLRGGVSVKSIQADGHGRYWLDIESERVSAARVVIAAGLGSKSLAAQVGLDTPIRPQRGQILVTERLEQFLPLPMSGLRQTREGTIMIGATHDDVGFDSSTTTSAAASLSANAIRRIPALGDVTLVRQWAGLRILTPDSYPIYAESQSCPGCFVALCHSGVTLAATHASTFAEAVAAGKLPQSLDVFHQRRFYVSKAA